MDASMIAPDGSPLLNQFTEMLHDAVNIFRGQGLTTGEVIGAFECAKLAVWLEAIEKEE